MYRLPRWPDPPAWHPQQRLPHAARAGCPAHGHTLRELSYQPKLLLALPRSVGRFASGGARPVEPTALPSARQRLGSRSGSARARGGALTRHLRELPRRAGLRCLPRQQGHRFRDLAPSGRLRTAVCAPAVPEPKALCDVSRRPRRAASALPLTEAPRQICVRRSATTLASHRWVWPVSKECRKGSSVGRGRGLSGAFVVCACAGLLRGSTRTSRTMIRQGGSA